MCKTNSKLLKRKIAGWPKMVASLRLGNETSEKELKTLKESNSQSKNETETLKSKIDDLQNKLKTSEKENS